MTAPVMKLNDFSQPFTVENDASETRIGAVLSRNKHLIAFTSKALGPKTKELSTYEKECMAIFISCGPLEILYVVGSGEFVILNDHHSIIHLSDQRLHTPWQHKAFTKLLRLTYIIVTEKTVVMLQALPFLGV